jgi:Nif-specific regulatory protein
MAVVALSGYSSYIVKSAFEGDLEVLKRLVRDRHLEVDTVLKSLVEELKGRFMADRATLYLVDSARAELVSRVAYLPEIEEIRLRLGEGLAGWVARERRPVLLNDGRKDPRFDPSIDRMTGYQTRSVLAVPILHESGESAGVVQLLNRKDRDFSEDDQASLEVYANKLARVLDALLGGQRQVREPLFFGFSGIIGQSQPMLEVYERLRKAAGTEAGVLIRGESGTGKELIARAIHCNSSRKSGPFVKVDCAALPETLVENELFGHERGAYTGADRTRPGKVQAADNGTLFLDEIGELPLSIQGKLLRLLQDRSFLQVGGSKPIAANVRFVFATHQPLNRLVSEGKFRADLYYRLKIIEITIPALRERGFADLDRLIEHFLYVTGQKYGRQLRLSEGARKKLHSWNWPGNVRELEHCLEAAVVLCEGGVIPAELIELQLEEPVALSEQTFDAPLKLARTAPELPAFASAIVSLDELELAYIRHVLGVCGGNRSAAARILGIGRNTLLRKLGAE